MFFLGCETEWQWFLLIGWCWCNIARMFKGVRNVESRGSERESVWSILYQATWCGRNHLQRKGLWGKDCHCGRPLSPRYVRHVPHNLQELLKAFWTRVIKLHEKCITKPYLYDVITILGVFFNKLLAMSQCILYFSDWITCIYIINIFFFIRWVRWGCGECRFHGSWNSREKFGCHRSPEKWSVRCSDGNVRNQFKPRDQCCEKRFLKRSLAKLCEVNCMLVVMMYPLVPFLVCRSRVTVTDLYFRCKYLLLDYTEILWFLSYFAK